MRKGMDARVKPGHDERSGGGSASKKGRGRTRAVASRFFVRTTEPEIAGRVPAQQE